MGYNKDDIILQLKNINFLIEDLGTKYGDIDSKIDILDNKVYLYATQLDDFKLAWEKMENMDWTSPCTIIDDENTVFEKFVIYGSNIRIKWIVSGNSPNSWIKIKLMYENGTYHDGVASSGIGSNNACEIYIEEPGDYYVEIESYDIKMYIIIIHDYY